jgi:predicted dehydrogenase
MKKVRIGLLGCGPIAQNAHLPAIEKARDVHLQAIADTDPALRTQVGQRYGVETIYESGDQLFADANVDLVVLAVGDRLHVPLAAQAVEAGKHVLVEKPLGISTQECEKLRFLVPPDRIFAVGCNRRFLPGVRAAKMARRLQNAGVSVRIVSLLLGHDPNSYFVAGASASDFAACLRQAQSL